MTRTLRARTTGRGKHRQRRTIPADLPPRKEQAACCQARLDALGRPPIGFCGPECERRPTRGAA